MTPRAIAKLPAETATLLRESHACALLDSLAVVKASGPGIRDYVQGQITQDLTLLAPEQGIYTAVLTPQGKAVADMRIIEGRGDELVMITEAACAEALVARLRRFALGYKVRIGIVETLAVLAVQGPGTDAVLLRAGLPLPGSKANAAAAMSEREGFSLRLPMAAEDGVWIIGRNSEVSIYISQLGHSVTAQDMEAARIAYGFPRFGIDWDESLHPLNANLIERHGVSFDKGCYVGQEVTSRMHWRRQIKWRLYRVELDAAVSSLPCAVEADGRMGAIASLAQTDDGKLRGIASLRIEAVASGHDLSAAGVPLRILGQALPL